MTDNRVLDRTGEEIAANDVVLFMKGTPSSHNAASRRRPGRFSGGLLLRRSHIVASWH